MQASPRVRIAPFLIAGMASACAGAQRAPASTTRPSCTAPNHWTGIACEPRSTGEAALARAEAAIVGFRPEEALTELVVVRENGPHRYETLVKLHEQSGIALAYLDREAEAETAFRSLLALAPRHLLSYTLSPRVTFLYERVRKDLNRAQPPVIDLSWPRELMVSQPVPVDVEIVAAGEAGLRRATIELRRKGSTDYRSVDLPLAAPGDYRRVVLPQLGGRRPGVLQLFVRAYDDRGNEVLRWGTADRPREIPLSYRAPMPWYRTWWVWAIAGTAVATTTGVAVYLLQREPPAKVGGRLDFQPWRGSTDQVRRRRLNY